MTYQMKAFDLGITEINKIQMQIKTVATHVQRLDDAFRPYLHFSRSLSASISIIRQCFKMRITSGNTFDYKCYHFLRSTLGFPSFGDDLEPNFHHLDLYFSPPRYILHSISDSNKCRTQSRITSIHYPCK